MLFFENGSREDDNAAYPDWSMAVAAIRLPRHATRLHWGGEDLTTIGKTLGLYPDEVVRCAVYRIGNWRKPGLLRSLHKPMVCLYMKLIPGFLPVSISIDVDIYGRSTALNRGCNVPYIYLYINSALLNFWPEEDLAG